MSPTALLPGRQLKNPYKCEYLILENIIPHPAHPEFSEFASPLLSRRGVRGEVIKKGSTPCEFLDFNNSPFWSKTGDYLKNKRPSAIFSR